METRGTFVSVKRIAQVFFLLGVFAKQFYLLPSGSFQIGDALMMGSMLILLVFRDWQQLKLDKRDYWLVGFVLCVIFINGIYILIYGMDYQSDFHFHSSILNYVYILFIVLVFRQFCEDPVFLRALRWVLQAAILLQTVFCVLDITERYAGSRLVGTFNDPNQCAFYLMSAIFLVYLISKMTGEGHPWLWFIPVFYCIIETSSTGMMLGVAIFFVLAVVFKIINRSVKSAIALLVVLCIVLGVVFLFATGRVQLSEGITQSLMYRRIIGKMQSFGIDDGDHSVDLDSFVHDRTLEKIVTYPDRLLYGAGEGYYDRLPAGGNDRQEIHSSVLGPLFYYGIIPCLMWFIWTGIQLKGIKRELWCVYLALIAESITLVNNRQPFFWMIFVLAGSCLAKKDYVEKEACDEASIKIPKRIVSEMH